MKAKFILLTASALAVAVSCVKELDITSGETPVVLTIHQENSGASRTQLMDAGTEVYWTPGDAISIFTAPYKNYRFEAQNAEPALSTEFSGTVSGTMPASFVAIYPYSSSNSIINGSSASDYNLYNYRITATIPTTQAATEGSFGPGAFPLAALAQSNSFTVYALAGGVKFSLQNAGICKVVFKSNSGERLSGQIYAGLLTSDPVPGNIKCDNGSTKATLEAAQGSTLSPGVDYFIVLAPGELSVGFTMDFYKEDGTVASVSTDRPVTVKRRTFGVLGVVDEGITDFRDPTPEMVDLGLSVKWASCNVGATSPTDFGGYYAWGETEEKDSYNISNYKYGVQDGDDNPYFTKYCVDPNWSPEGIADDKFILEKEDDAAYAMYGDFWRTPTEEEWKELRTGCTWEWTEMKGVKGYRVSGKKQGYTDKFIFLPAAGYINWGRLSYVKTSGGYLSSELDWETLEISSDISIIRFSSSGLYYSTADRSYNAFSVRPVYGEPTEVSSISLDVSELTLDYLDEHQFTATVVPEDAPVTWSVQRMGGTCGVYFYERNFYANQCGTFRVIARSGNRYASCIVKVPVVQPEPVDMGLSVAWASTDLGSDSGFEPGLPYAWGETEVKSRCTRSNYRYWNGSDYTKYSYYSDGLDFLLAEDDAATQALGLGWRIPSEEDWFELVENCDWTWDNDYYGYRLTSRITGNEIFFPSEANYCTRIGYDEDAVSVHFEGYSELGPRIYPAPRWEGLSIRPVHESVVDLGLSVKWASCNLGATKPEEYGNYYAWGETEPKEDYSESTYKWCMGSYNTMTKYCNKSGYGYNGFTDNKTVLDPEDDAAAVNLGGSWRMATYAEWDELKAKCTWTWTTQNGVNGYLVTGPNGNSIFLPAAGYRSVTNLYEVGSYGLYWSPSLYTDYLLDAYYVDFYSDDVVWSSRNRFYGFSVRPVSE